jgi:serine/threonine protein kinase
VLNQYVAYKIFDPSSFHQSDIEFLKKRFIREGKKLIGYRHPNIVAGYEIGNIEDIPYIQMEYVEGKTLLQFVKDTNPNNIARINLANDLISAIGYAHSKEDIHRDLSYSNIIISNTGELKLLDFGFSKGDLDTSYDTTQCPVRTKFSPPELASGSEYNFSSEVYCIGAIVYSIFTGYEFNIQNLNEINEIDIPLLYKHIILKCLDREPKNRFSRAFFIRYHINKSQFTNQSSSLLLPEKKDDFSLDGFQEKVNITIRNIIFHPGHYPTFNTIQAWVSDGLREYIGENLYLTNGSFADLIFRMNGAKRISWYNGADKTIYVSYLRDLYSYFLNINEQQRDFFFKTFFSIIKRVAVEEVPGKLDDVPF